MTDRDRIFKLANLNDHGQEISEALDRLEKLFADERERCFEMCEHAVQQVVKGRKSTKERCLAAIRSLRKQ